MRKKLDREPLYGKLAKLLREDIRKEYIPGTRLPSESSLASQYGVSVMTLREALSALAQEGLIERVHGKGNYVRDTAKNQHIAILNELDLSSTRGVSGFFMACIRKVAQQLEKEGYPFRFYFGHTPAGTTPPPRPTCPAFWEAYDRNSISGVIAITTWLNPEWTKLFDERMIPIVDSPAGTYSGELYDDMLRQGMEYLIGRGCQKIAVFRYAQLHSPSEALADKERLRRRFPEFAPMIHDIYYCSFNEGPFSPETVFSEIWAYPDLRPDGLVVLDDMIFMELMGAFSKLNVSVPDELKVVTHQNRGVNNFNFFPVACLVVDPDEIAEGMSSLMMERLRNFGTAPTTPVIRAVLEEQNALLKITAKNNQSATLEVGS